MLLSKNLLALIPVVAIAFAGCAAEVPDEDVEEDSAPVTGTCAGVSVGACSGTAMDRAVRCATRLGARVLSFYRSPAQQECVRRQNRCTNRCSGSAGCVRPTAGCTTSGHTRCTAVDFIADGAPVTRAQLRRCGLAKTTAPHANHYDLVGEPAASVASSEPPDSEPDSDPSPPQSQTPAPSPSGGGSCKSATLGAMVPPGTCVQRDDDRRWYVCDGDDPAEWPMVAGPSDPDCTSCPQLSGGTCSSTSSGGKY